MSTEEHQLPSHEGEGNTDRHPIEVQEMKCIRCGNVINSTFPKARLVKSKACTILIWIHEDFLKCPHCNQAYLFVFQGVQGMQLSWAPVPDEIAYPKQSPIVSPPAGFDPVKGANQILQEMKQANETLKGR